MYTYRVRTRDTARRPGKVLALFAILLPTLLALVGLVTDLGLVFAQQRQLRSAADGAAMAAATELFVGWNDPSRNWIQVKNDARTRAETFVRGFNGFSGAVVEVRFPDTPGGFTENPYRKWFATRPNRKNFVEVLVQHEVPTWIMWVGGVQRQQVDARAMAGFEPPGWPEGFPSPDLFSRRHANYREGIVTLEETDAYLSGPGLELFPGSRMVVGGMVVVNSFGGGVDQYGDRMSRPAPAAIDTNVTATLQARYTQVRGGVDVLLNISGFPPIYRDDGNYLYCSGPRVPDPLNDPVYPERRVPVPMLSNGVVNRTQTDLYLDRNGMLHGTLASFNSYDPPPQPGQPGTLRLGRGIYERLKIEGNHEVIFESGIYVIKGNGDPDGGLNLLDNVRCDPPGGGVMFYNTGNDYSPSSGFPDVNDTESSPAMPFNSLFSPIRIESSNVTLTGLSAPPGSTSRPFNGLLIYQRRWSPRASEANRRYLRLGPNAGTAGPNLTGTIYARRAMVEIAPGQDYKTQFVVGKMRTFREGDVILGPASIPMDIAKYLQSANRVFLVE